MVARLKLTRTVPVLAFFALLLLVVVWQAGKLDPRSWIQVHYSGSYGLHTEETLFAALPLVVEGTLVYKGEGVTPRSGDDPSGVPYDLYELDVSHVWAGPKEVYNLPLAFIKNTPGVKSDSHAHVQDGEKYVFFLSLPFEPRSGGIWKGLYPLGDNEQLIWRPIGDNIVPTAPHFKTMTRSEFAAFIAAQSEEQE